MVCHTKGTGKKVSLNHRERAMLGRRRKSSPQNSDKKMIVAKSASELVVRGLALSCSNQRIKPINSSVGLRCLKNIYSVSKAQPMAYLNKCRILA